MEKIITHLKKDAVLTRIIENLEPLIPIVPYTDIYPSLIRSIISQQLSTKAAASIHQRFLEFVGEDHDKQTFISINDDSLRSLGLSYSKIKYIKNIVQFFLDNPTFDSDITSMADEEIIEKLVQIKGVGVWTVQMLLIFTLGSEDVLPLDDLIVRKGIIYHYGLDETAKDIKQQCMNVGENWKPYRSTGSRYMWAAKDQMKR